MVDDVSYTEIPPESQPGERRHFGRLKRFDERSLGYLIRGNRLNLWKHLTARLRTKVNHRVWWNGNQGDTARCTAYGGLHMWEAGVAHARGRGRVLHDVIRPIIRPHFLYTLTQTLDPWEGSETVAPYYEGSSGTAMAMALRQLGFITGFDWEFNDIEVCMRAIFTGPLGFGLDWHIGMMAKQDCRYPEEAIIRPTGKFIGGHFVAAVGYDKNRKGWEWEILNSWGFSWGYKGRCYIGNDDLGTLLMREGECVMLRDVDDITALAAYERYKLLAA